MCLQIFRIVANSVDPDQTPRSVASDLGLHGLQVLSVRVHKVKKDSRLTLLMTKLAEY